MKKNIKNCRDYGERIELLIDENINELFKNIKGLNTKNPASILKINRASDNFKKHLERIVKYCNNLQPLWGKKKENYNFYDYYVNLALNYNDLTIESVTTNQVLQFSKNILITGLTGSGKSTLMKHLFLSFLMLEKGDKYIPIYIEIKKVRGKEKIEEYLYNFLGKNLSFTFEEFEDMLDSGKFLFLFDGTDEKDLIDSKVILDNIDKFRAKYNDNAYIVTARPNPMFIEWYEFEKMELNPIKTKQMIEMIKKLDLDKEIERSFIAMVSVKLHKTHKSFLSNPLMVSVMLLIFIDGGSIPFKMNLFFEQAFITLFNRHDTSEETKYEKLMSSGLDIKEFEAVFSFFCHHTYINKITFFSKSLILNILREAKNYIKLNFDENNYFLDLFKAVCLIIDDKLESNGYIFTHITFQKYFMAIYIKNIVIKKEYKKKLIDFMLTREGYEYNLIYEVLFDEDLTFLEKEIVIPILKEIKIKTSYQKIDTLESFKLFCKLILEKKINDSNKNSLDVNIDMFLEDLYKKYEMKYTFKEFEKVFTEIIKEKIDNPDISTHDYSEDLFREIVFIEYKETEKKVILNKDDIRHQKDDIFSLKVNKILPIDIKIDRKEFFFKIINFLDTSKNNFSELENNSFKNLFLLYFYLMYILEEIEGKYNDQDEKEQKDLEIITK
jgi:energy-coupling factor transporter ATP-binding protein EcfA2